MLRGPIAPHPNYGASDDDLRPAIQNPRVKLEARDIYLKSQGNLDLVLDVNGESLSLPARSSRKTKVHKDHIHENVRRMRKLQKDVKRKEDCVEPPKAVKDLWKSDKYSTVESKLVQQLKETPKAPRPQSANYLRAHSRTGFTSDSRPTTAVSTCASELKLSVPKASEASNLQLIRRDIDFIKSNGVSARRPKTRENPREAAESARQEREDRKMKEYRKGYIPKYLVARREQWAVEEVERQRELADADMPEGHRRMAEEERLNTLELLKKNQQSLITRLNTLPIRTDTYRVRTEKEKVQSRLAEVEEAIKIFSRPKVYVKSD